MADNPWLQNMVQLEQTMSEAMKNFYLSADKELAIAAAYKALGMDPRDAPKFGWNRSVIQPPPLVSPPVSSPTPTPVQEQPVRAPRWLLPLLGAGGVGALLGSGLIGYLLSRPSTVVQPKVQDTELRVKWWVEDGKIKTAVEPVKGE